MHFKTYKGYNIEIDNFDGKFSIAGTSGYYGTYQGATARVDAIMKAEKAEGYPINAISSAMKVGKITSYNNEEKAVWFTKENGERSKESIRSYIGTPKFYADTPANRDLVVRFNELDDLITQKAEERDALPEKLIEPIVFK